jgi:hypothetical protein
MNANRLSRYAATRSDNAMGERVRACARRPHAASTGSEKMKVSTKTGFKRLLLPLLALAAAPHAADAMPITVPAGLAPGGEYRLAFVRSATRDALSANIADYNAFVLTAANAVPELAALGTNWTAIASTRDADARDNTQTNPLTDAGVAIFRLDGMKIADDNNDLWDCSVDAPISVDEFGNVANSTRAWTGNRPDGTASDWPLGGGTSTPNVSAFGLAGSADCTWTEYAFPDDNTLQGNLHALSGVLTVDVAEPAAFGLFGLGLAGLALGRAGRRGRRHDGRSL